jgi:hypothetical protein
MKFFGIFYGLGTRDHLWMSASFLRLAFIVAVVVFTVRMELMHLVLYAAAAAACVTLVCGLKSSVVELVNSAAVYAALMTLNIIYGYYNDVDGSPHLMAIYCLLGLFVFLYTLYFFIRGIGDLMIRKIAEYEPGRAAR